MFHFLSITLKVRSFFGSFTSRFPAGSQSTVQRKNSLRINILEIKVESK